MPAKNSIPANAPILQGSNLSAKTPGRPPRSLRSKTGLGWRETSIQALEDFVEAGSLRLARGATTMPLRQLTVALPRVVESLASLRGDATKVEVNVTHRVDRRAVEEQLRRALDVPSEVLVLEKSEVTRD